MKYGIRNLIRKVHHSIPPQIRNSYVFIIVFIRRIGNYFMPLRFYIIKDNDTGEHFTFVHIGWDTKLCYYWLNRFSDEFETGLKSRTIATWNITKFLKNNKEKIDIAIIESTEKAISGKYPYSFLLPRWMEMGIHIESTLKKPIIKEITRAIKKYSLKYEIREGIESFDLFYHKMYKPYLLKRHGIAADIAEYKHFSHKFQTENCVLFFIIRENEPIASAFIEIKKNGYRLSALGIKDGNKELLKMGVIGALYYFVMLYYYNKGAGYLFAGNSMSVVFDGVTEYKLHLGAKPYLDDLDDRSKYYFMPMNTKPFVVKILKSNPLYYLSDCTLNIALFISDEDFDSKEEFFKYFNRVKTKNVERTKVFCFNNPTKVIQWIHEENIANIEFSEYECSNGNPIDSGKIRSEKYI